MKLRRYKKKNHRKLKSFFVGLIWGGIIIGILYYLYSSYQKIEIKEEKYQSEKLEVSTTYGQTVENEKENNKKIADVIEDVTKCVCGISKLKNAGKSILSMATETELGLGTGIIVSDNGYILSNSHVTGEKYSTCYVTIEDKTTYRGTVVWSDEDLDLSITKITAKDLPYIELGSSKNVRVGEAVYAIGNPIGYEFRRTVTSGIISALNRTIKIEENDKTSYMTDLIQTDATINPGNSGGPLICIDGKAIGVNSVKITSAEGIGFAVPIDVIKPVLNSYIEKGKFEEATLGIYGYDYSIEQTLNFKNNFKNGVYVEKIIKGSSADRTKLSEKDIINKIDGIKIETLNDLRQYIYSKSPGDTINLTVNEDDYKKEKTIEITLKKK